MANVTASSLLATSSPGQVTQDISLDLPVTGIEATSLTGQAVSGIGVEQSGIQATSSSGSVTIDDQFLIGGGWGRETWGSFVWGDAYSVQLQGIPLSIVTGNEDAFTDVTVAVSGQQLQIAITPVGTSANADHEIAASLLISSNQGDVTVEGTALVEPTGISSSVEIGDAEAGLLLEVPVTGVSANLNLGNSDQIGTATIDLTGIGLTANLGTITPVSSYEPGSASATISAGQVTAVGEAVVIPTGVTLTISTIAPNIIAWSEVDTGTQVTWTDVDLAA